jgi:hypothetical protein
MTPQVSPPAPDLIACLHVDFVHRADSGAAWSTAAAQLPRSGVSRSSRARRSTSAVPTGDAAEAAMLLLRHSLPSAVHQGRAFPIGALLHRAWQGAATPGEDAVLKSAGIRPVVDCAGGGIATCWCPRCRDARGRPVPRGGAGDGVWLANQSRTIEALFAATQFSGCWRFVLLGLPRARRSFCNVRIGRHAGRAIWLAASELKAMVAEHSGAS